MRDGKLALEWLPATLAVCRLPPEVEIPSWAAAGGPAGFVSITRTDRELSIVVEEGAVPTNVRAERGWVGLRVVGTLELSTVGVLARLTGALAEEGVPVFAVSTYETDVLLVKSGDAGRAVEALREVADCSRL